MHASAVPRKIDFLLLGGGLASATAAEALRLEGAQGSIAMVSAEPEPPYQRPPLSKALLLHGPASELTPVLDAGSYHDLGIELLRGTRALSVDTRRRIVTTDRAGPLAYGKLLIATGARPLRFHIPGSGLQGIHSLRDIGDALALHAAAQKGARAVVIGASFIGMEVSTTLRRMGVHVSLLAQHGRVFDTLQSVPISRFFSEQCASHGIEVHAGEPVAFEGSDRVSAVVSTHGLRLPCDFVVIGIGVAPEVDFLADSGIALADGVVVDERLQASVPGVFAAGDVASFLDPVFKARRRGEHWDNAVKQGKLAARNMLGQGLPFDEVSAFFCEALGTSFQFVGLPDGAPDRLELGSHGTRSWGLVYLQGEIPHALFTTERPVGETQAIRSLIRHHTHVGRFKSRLRRPGFSMASIPNQTVLILQGGGAMGAFESGVVRALEQRHLHADVVAGVSIGAFNGAIVASHPRNAADALEAFWHDLAMVTPQLSDEPARRLLSSSLAMTVGVPAFFLPRWLLPPSGALGAASWTSLYDTTPVRDLLARYVDFEAMRSSPVRLLVSAVDVESAELRIFDSHVDALTVDHIVASGSLPPALPWTTIDGRNYWDGALVSNSPLDQVMERCGVAGKRIFIVDLFPSARPLPANLMEVALRRDEIAYAERVRRTCGEQATLSDFRKLVEEIVAQLPSEAARKVRQRPRYTELMSPSASLSITRILRPVGKDESASRDFDFSLPSIRANSLSGYETALHVLRAMRSAQGHERPPASP
ncbi:MULTISPECIES: FAD-dependent oxidoreductase [unclassified Variovorax]|uniref:FAD-dependent oxidoreductase n=1 Tax=unclassified Variovorax TaxID=663243 RepID=UPI000D1215F8|nr:MULTISPECIES: FAD-dependent oxidoreductase [unclassified Variovorax]AVQ85637.1 pyridine nucleotide-disulfide oxidoreductase [Variovorax sp. PMC12]QRY35267.1 FAD-dependent oxidoreductase [Variovorax sp. PDNC026]